MTETTTKRQVRSIGPLGIQVCFGFRASDLEFWPQSVILVGRFRRKRPTSATPARRPHQTLKLPEYRRKRLYAAAAGTRARATFGTSVQPSMCWQVRIQMAVPAFGTPYRATYSSVMSLQPSFGGGSSPRN